MTSQRTLARWIPINAMLVVVALSTSVGATDDDKFVSLFDGKTFAGWVHQNGKEVTRGWTAKDGVLEFSGKGGTIMTAKEYGDFDLRFDFNIVAGGNSGVKYKFKKFGNDWLGCEFQVLDDGKHGDGKKGRTSTGSLYHVCEPNEKKKLNPPGEWNSARVVIKGSRIEHWLNGEKILEIDTRSDEWKERIQQSKFRKVKGFGQNKLGRIMLQDHGSKVSYRNLKLRPLN